LVCAKADTPATAVLIGYGNPSWLDLEALRSFGEESANQHGRTGYGMSQEKILIVEDDPDMRLGYQILLNAHHYQTFFAADISSALRQLSAHLPDLVILDIGLPGPDGFTVLEEFDKYVFLAPVIVISAREPDGNKDRALEAGARAYLQKPWDDNELLATIRALLAENEPSESLPAI
jgi:DNA-binding response OmpR family regulator